MGASLKLYVSHSVCGNRPLVFGTGGGESLSYAIREGEGGGRGRKRERTILYLILILVCMLR